MVDGSFCDANELNLAKKIETTLTVILAFTVGKDDIKIYINQLSKSIRFIKKCLDENREVFDDKLYVLSVIAFNSVINKSVFKDKLQGDISEKIAQIQYALKENNLQKSLSLINQIEKNSFKTVLCSIIEVGDLEKILEESIKSMDEKDAVSKLAKLSILKSINK